MLTSRHSLSITLFLLAAVHIPATTASNFLDLNALESFSPASAQHERLLAYSQALANSTDVPDTSSSSLSTGASPVASSHKSAEVSNPDRHPPDQDWLSGGETSELVKRAGACGLGYRSCRSLGDPSLCCPNTAVCSADYSGQIACCPIGAACTGVVAGGHPRTSPGGGASYTVVTTTRNSQPTSSNGGFVIAGSSTVAVLGDGNAATSPRPNQIFGLVTMAMRASNWLWSSLAGR